MTAWTPGPWTVADENRNDLQNPSRFGPVIVYAEADCNIHPVADCSCNHTCRKDNEQLANARLIAAAPELYEALERLLDRYGMHSNGDIKFAADALARVRGALG